MQQEYCVQVPHDIRPGSRPSGFGPFVLRASPHLRLALAAFIAALIAPAVRAQQTAPTGMPGQAVFSQRCAVCHGDQGQGISARVTIAGPSLQAEHDVNIVMKAVREGRGVMPTFGRILRDQDIEDVSRYITVRLATIPVAGGNLSEGGILFRTHCAACHRTAVRGGALALVQTNAPALDTQSTAVIAGAIRWGPGPMPAFPPSLISNQQLASIVDYVQFVQHPPNPGGNPLHWYGPVVEGLVACLIVCALTAIAMWIEKGGKG